MEYWTDIFAEELKEIEVSLPADDWDVVQQKYAAAQRRRKAVVWWWTGAAASVAAVLAVVIFLFRDPEAVQPEMIQPGVILREVPVYTEVEDVAPVQEQLRIVPTPVEAEDYDLVAESKEGEISVVRDTAVAPTEVFVAENLYEGAEENVEREAPELRERRKRVTISLGAYATGGIAGGTILPKAMDMAPTIDPPEANNPVDTSGFYTPETVPMSRRGRKVKSSSETHHLPVSYGVSARFKLTRRFSINTGLDYTLYNSSFKTEYTDGSTVTEKQSAHYLGIPVRFDWMLVDRPHFGMYMGIGGQINKCIYAKRGEKRLHEYNMLYSLGATVGVQYNVNSRFSLYLEPDLGFNLNEGDINTYRNGGEFMFTARAGLRINL